MKYLVPILLTCGIAWSKDYCIPHETSCWPTSDHIDKLTQALDTTAKRILSWSGLSQARVSAVPLGSPNDQPLYGLGEKGLKPVYVRGE